jgi:hypothetical protein
MDPPSDVTLMISKPFMETSRNLTSQDLTEKNNLHEFHKRCSEFIPNDGGCDDDNSEPMKWKELDESGNLTIIEHQNVPVNVELRRSNRVRKTNQRYLSDEFEHS